jgi:hypothetical protein
LLLLGWQRREWSWQAFLERQWQVRETALKHQTQQQQQQGLRVAGCRLLAAEEMSCQCLVLQGRQFLSTAAPAAALMDTALQQLRRLLAALWLQLQQQLQPAAQCAAAPATAGLQVLQPAVLLLLLHGLQ